MTYPPNPHAHKSVSKYFLVVIAIVALVATVGCDTDSPELTGVSPSSEISAPQASASFKSPSELNAQRSEYGTALRESGQLEWIQESRTVQIQGRDQEIAGLKSENDIDVGDIASQVDVSPSSLFLSLSEGNAETKTTAIGHSEQQKGGAFKRSPHAFGLDTDVEMPEPDAAGTTSGIRPSSIQICPSTCGGTGGGGTGGGGDDGGDDGGENDPPSFFGTSSLYFDNSLQEGYASWEAKTETGGGSYVDEIQATTQNSITVDNGAYQETTPPYSFQRSFANEASVLASRYHYAGNVEHNTEGEHSITEDGSTPLPQTSSAGASTNFSSSNCAPFPVAGDDGNTIPEDGTVSLEWQTICPQKNKVLQINRTSGPGGSTSSAAVETAGDGWSISAFEAWNGLFLNGGTYEWTIKASGESATRSGTFSIASSDLCRPSATIEAYSPPELGNTNSGSLAGTLSDCAPSGTYFFALRVVLEEGTQETLGTTTLEVTGDESDLTWSFPIEQSFFTNDQATLEVFRQSPYNGSAKIDQVPFDSL